ncbi:MAG: glycosyltransferase [Patescibacteria group bacterium]
MFFPTTKQNNKFLISFHGKFIPLQGTIKIALAIKELIENTNIHFRFVGDEQDFSSVHKILSPYLSTGRLEFIPRVSLVKYSSLMKEASVILGIFGDSEKTDRVIPNKIYEGLASGKAVISEETTALKEIFTSDDILMIKGDIPSIAWAINKLYTDDVLRHKLESNGLTKVKNYNPKQIGQRLIRVIENAMI